jgi:hypothetical protein
MALLLTPLLAQKKAWKWTAVEQDAFKGMNLLL